MKQIQNSKRTGWGSMRCLAGFLLAVFALAGCVQDEVVTATEEGKEVKVAVSLGTLPAEGTDTRATAPHTPEVENLIHDIWVLQFNESGILLDTPEKYFPREGESGLYVEDFRVTLIAAQNSTVCLVVNTNGPSIVWPNNLPDFQKMLLKINASNDLSERDRMPMCGYWKGNVTDVNQVLTVMLCRMMTRVNLVLNNETGAELTDLSVTLDKVPTRAYVYPSINQTALPDGAYSEGTWTDESLSIAAGGSQQLYYYMAPNICSDGTNATQVTVTSGGKTWTVTLGTDAPGTTNRDYALYANNYYTFTLNLH